MILISYQHYTCGGLLCNIFNNEFAGYADHGGMEGNAHSFFKSRDDGQLHLSPDAHLSPTEIIHKRIGTWIEQGNELPLAAGTHFLPNEMPLDMFERVINITTETTQSKIYRWIRAYQLYYLRSEPFAGLTGMDLIDKARETAKLYITPQVSVVHRNVTNIEFYDIVEKSQKWKNLVAGYPSDKLVDMWKDKNKFLYVPDDNTDEAINRFFEAEYEVRTGKRYNYA